MKVLALDAPTTDRAPLVTLYAASAVSIIGNFTTLVALPWFILELTGSATKTGLTLIAVSLPQVLAGFFANGFVDRLGYRRTSVLADLVAGGTVALVPLLYHAGSLPFALLLLLVFCGNLFNAPGNTARQSMLPDLIALSGVPPARANAWYQSVFNLSQLVGPVFAGVAIPLVGTSNVLWIDAGSFAFSACAVLVGIPTLGRGGERARTPYIEQLREGVRFIWRDRLLLALTAMFGVTSFTGPAFFTLILAIYAKEEYGSALALGLLRGGWGAGALIGALAYATVAHRLPRRRTYAGAFLLCGAILALLCWVPPLAVAVAAMVASAAVFGPVSPVRLTVQQERTPAALRSRVFGTGNAVGFLATPLGVLAFANLATTRGVVVTIAVDLGIFMCVGLATWFLPVFRSMDMPVAALATAEGADG